MSSYRPETLVSFVTHEAALATHQRKFVEFVTANRSRLPKQTEGGVHSVMDRPTRAMVRHFEVLINAAATRTGLPPWRLVALFDSVMPPDARTPIRRRSGDVTNEATAEQTVGVYVEVDPELPGDFMVEGYAAGPSRSKPEVNLRGAAMRSYLNGRGGADLAALAFPTGEAPVAPLEGATIRSVIEATVSDLLIVACEPAGSGGLEATRLAAEAGTVAIEHVRRHFEAKSPMAWRLLRVVSECLRRQGRWDSEGSVVRDGAEVRRAAFQLLRYIDDANPPGVYRARSLFEEAVGLFPKDNPDFNNWALPMLRRRAVDGKSGSGEAESVLPVRERVMAAWTYTWRLAKRPQPHPSRPDEKFFWEASTLQPLGQALDDDARGMVDDLARQLQTGDTDRGLVYAGEFLQAALESRHFWVPHPVNDQKMLKEEPLLHRFWGECPEAQIVFDAVRVETEHQGYEPFLLNSLAALSRQACLTIDGVSRRECLTTMQYARRGPDAARIFTRIIETTDSTRYRWLAEVATFCLGWVTDPSNVAATRTLLAVSERRDLDASIRMTALMALGDIADRLRHAETADRAVEVATTIAQDALASYPAHSNPHNAQEKVLLRAALYALGMLRHSAELTVPVLQEVVDLGIEFFGEPATPGLAQWGLDRFAVRTLGGLVLQGSEPTESLRRSVEHQGPAVFHGRRLVDPLASLAVVSRY